MSNKKPEYEEIVDNTKIIHVDVEHEMKHSFIAYAMAVNVSRAIPDVRDGLKPVHRRILYAMNELGLDYSKPTRKCARIVGDVLGKYHPHGDSAVYEALVRLAQDFTIRCPLVFGQGNFGSVDGDPAAAQRYTEAKLSRIAAEMLRDIDKETVDFYPNFDDTLMQPTVLPARFPNLLVNGADGIAVGMATSIPPHNLGEVINATVALLDDPDITVDDLLKYVPCPDFPTGGIVMDVDNIRQAYRTGRGSCIIRAKTEIVEHNGRSRIIVHELPYQVNKAKLIKYIADMVKDKKIEGIADINDESDRKGMRLVIDVKKEFNARVVLNTLFKHCDLQVSYSMIFLALDQGYPKIMNLKQILEAYVKYQQEVIERRTRFDLEKALEREHILKGLVIAQQNIDEVVALIRGSADKADAQSKLMARFDLSEKQANAILELKLQRLTALEVDKLIEELDALEKAIAEYRDILANPLRINGIIRDELLEIESKYSTARRSELSYEGCNIDLEDLIDREDIVISLTKENYIKRSSMDEFKSQHRGGIGVTAHRAKDSDQVEKLFVSSTHDNLFFFSDFGKVYILKGYEIPDASRVGRGRTINNIINIEQDEKITTILRISEEDAAREEGYLMLATRKGKIKKTPVAEFESIRSSGKIAIKMDDDDQLVAATFVKDGDQVLLASSIGKCIRFVSDAVRPMGRTAYGVKSMDIDGDDYVVSMNKIEEGKEVLTVTTNGYGKRTHLDEFRVQGRAGKGIMAGKFNEKTGRIVDLKLVDETGDVLLITAKGIIIRTHISEISVIGRTGQGVRIMKTGAGEVVAVALAPYYAEEDEEAREGETVGEGEILEDAQETAETDTDVTDGEGE
ncbi:MAG: DNA gyrase subunit A [Clostridia bacterium]|nr:DNA gyrase subunit A [Clostridia bacterium]